MSRNNSGAKYLYIFEVSKNTNTEECYNAFRNAKENRVNNRAYARLNNPSNVFYVGTSKSLAARLRQHLG